MDQQEAPTMQEIVGLMTNSNEDPCMMVSTLAQEEEGSIAAAALEFTVPPLDSIQELSPSNTSSTEPRIMQPMDPPADIMRLSTADDEKLPSTEPSLILSSYNNKHDSYTDDTVANPVEGSLQKQESAEVVMNLSSPASTPEDTKETRQSTETKDTPSVGLRSGKEGNTSPEDEAIHPGDDTVTVNEAATSRAEQQQDANSNTSSFVQRKETLSAEGGEQPSIVVATTVEAVPVITVDPQNAVHEAETSTTFPVVFDAPTDLSAGYKVPLEIQGKTVMAEVPPGGAKRGEKVYANVTMTAKSEEDDNVVVVDEKTPMAVPRGGWKNELFDCFQHRDTPFFWLAWCFTPGALGQLMTRMNLNWVGEVEETRDSSAFYFLTVAGAVSYAYYIIFVGINAAFAWVVLALLYSFGIVVMVKTRGYIRGRDEIDGSDLNDICVSAWCGCCAVVQMVTHTSTDQHRDSATSYHCCSPTGFSPPLQASAPEADPNDEREKSKRKRRTILWSILGGLALLFIILAPSTRNRKAGVRGGGTSSSTGSSGCSYGYKYCYVNKCQNEFNGFTGRLEYKCGLQYEYEYVYCDRCP